jgi:ATP-dependent RNA helicase RhlE
LLQRLQRTVGGGAKRHVRALVLVPTRELAAQVEQSIMDYGRYIDIKSMVIFGGVNINPQLKKLRSGVDIVVATPGRLLDHMSQGTIKLDRIETLILDEADRMLDMGFIRDIQRIVAATPTARQTLLFSATFSHEIRELSKKFMVYPEEIQVAKRNETADKVTQMVHPVDKTRKRELLAHLITEQNWYQALVFTRTKHGANRLALQLSKEGIQSAAIHGNKSQAARTRALKEFKEGKTQVLVATDIAARGLDIEQLPHVVNYELPNVPEDYVHRIGRTGRAGQSGHAVSLVSADETKLLHDIEKLLGHPLKREVVRGFKPDESIRTRPSVQQRKRASNKAKPGASGGQSQRRRLKNSGRTR